MFLDPKNIGSLTNLLIFGFLGSHYGSHLELHFFNPKNIGFDVLHTNLVIFGFLGSHFGSNLELQLFGPYLGLALRLI